MFIIMNTVARTVENERIHLYLHLRYVKRPAKIAKNEYHRRVSPIVLKGGRSRLIHRPAMNEASTASDAKAHMIAPLRLRRYRRDD
jgi:hypothetical protein